MEITQLYNDIIEKLKNDQRPMVNLGQEQIKNIHQKWQEILEQAKNGELEDTTTLHQILCILDNTRTLSGQFEELIIKTLEKTKDPQTIIYTLSAASKHIIEFRFRNGERLDFKFLETLKGLLSHPSAEAREWTLRLIEQVGPQSIMLKEEVLKIKPGLSSLFDKHKKATKQIIELLEKRWRPRE